MLSGVVNSGATATGRVVSTPRGAGRKASTRERAGRASAAVDSVAKLSAVRGDSGATVGDAEPERRRIPSRVIITRACIVESAERTVASAASALAYQRSLRVA